MTSAEVKKPSYFRGQPNQISDMLHVYNKHISKISLAEQFFYKEKMF
jgi:hypothetical protein